MVAGGQAEVIPRDTFGARLAIVRQRLGLNVVQAARLCRCSHSSWQNWEADRPPRAMDVVVRRISEATGFSRDWLMWGGPLAAPDDPRSRCDAAPTLFDLHLLDQPA